MYLDDYDLLIENLEMELLDIENSEREYHIKSLISNLKSQRQLLDLCDSTPSCIIISSIISFDTETYSKIETDVEGETLTSKDRPPYEKIRHEHSFIDEGDREQISITCALKYEDKDMEEAVRDACERAIGLFFTNNVIPVRKKFGVDHEINGNVMDYFYIDGRNNE